MISDFVPLIAAIGILIVVLGFIVIMRYFNYKEDLFFAEKGISRPEVKSVPTTLRWGIIAISLGFALTLGLFFANLRTSEAYPLHLGPSMLGGFVPLFLGIGLILILYLSTKE